MNDGAKFHRKTRQYATVWQRANVAAVNQAALTVKRSVLALTPRRLSGVGRRGAALGVRYDVKGFYGNPTALVRATGPFQLIERDTRSHAIPRGGERRPVALGPPYGRNGSGWVMGPVQHPGTKGKHPFERGVNRAEPVVRQVFRRAHTSALAATFR